MKKLLLSAFLGLALSSQAALQLVYPYQIATGTNNTLPAAASTNLENYLSWFSSWYAGVPTYTWISNNFVLRSEFDEYFGTNLNSAAFTTAVWNVLGGSGGTGYVGRFNINTANVDFVRGGTGKFDRIDADSAVLGDVIITNLTLMNYGVVNTSQYAFAVSSHGWNDTDLTWTNDTWMVLPLDGTAAHDPFSWYDDAGDFITLGTNGLYLITATVHFPDGTASAVMSTESTFMGVFRNDLMIGSTSVNGWNTDAGASIALLWKEPVGAAYTNRLQLRVYYEHAPAINFTLTTTNLIHLGAVRLSD